MFLVRNDMTNTGGSLSSAPWRFPPLSFLSTGEKYPFFHTESQKNVPLSALKITNQCEKQSNCVKNQRLAVKHRGFVEPQRNWAASEGWMDEREWGLMTQSTSAQEMNHRFHLNLFSVPSRKKKNPSKIRLMSNVHINAPLLLLTGESRVHPMWLTAKPHITLIIITLTLDGR